MNSLYLKKILYLCNGLWLLPLSRTYLIGYFFDDSSTSKLGGFNHTKVGNKMSAFGVYPTTDWLGICDISPAWAFVLLIRVKGSQGLDVG